MDDYRPNSNRFKEKDSVTESSTNKKPVEDKKIEKVIKGTAKPKKKSKLESFVADDISNVKHYVVSEVLLPSLKKAISEVVTNGLDMMLFGEVQDRRRRSSSSSSKSVVSYDRYYDRDRNGRARDTSRSRDGYEYDDVIVNTRVEADDVLGILDEAIDTFGSVSVGDLYDAVGMVGNYTDYKYGWTDLRSARVEAVRDGYLIRTPRAVALKKIN